METPVLSVFTQGKAAGKQMAPLVVFVLIALFTGFGATGSLTPSLFAAAALYLYVRYLSDDSVKNFNEFFLKHNVLREMIFFAVCALAYHLVIWAQQSGHLLLVAGFIGTSVMAFYMSKWRREGRW